MTPGSQVTHAPDDAIAATSIVTVTARHAGTKAPGTPKAAPRAPAIFSTSAFGLGLLTERSSADQEERSSGARARARAAEASRRLRFGG